MSNQTQSRWNKVQLKAAKALSKIISAAIDASPLLCDQSITDIKICESETLIKLAIEYAQEEVERNDGKFFADWKDGGKIVISGFYPGEPDSDFTVNVFIQGKEANKILECWEHDKRGTRIIDPEFSTPWSLEKAGYVLRRYQLID